MEMPIIIRCSLGAQSLLMAYWMALVGSKRTTRPWAVIFADTGTEHSYTYEARDHVRGVVREAGGVWLDADGPMIEGDERTTTLPGLWEVELAGVATRADQPPLWREDGGKTPTRCTRIAKVARGRRSAVEWLRSLGWKYGDRAEIWIGYAWDEARRVAAARHDVRWEAKRYPLFEARIDRQLSRQILVRNGLPCPGRSLCTMCGNKTAQMWRDTPLDHRNLAIEVDELFREGEDVGLQGRLYLSNERRPLREVFASDVPAGLAPHEYESLWPDTPDNPEAPLLSDLDLLSPRHLGRLLIEAKSGPQLLLPVFGCGDFGVCDT